MKRKEFIRTQKAKPVRGTKTKTKKQKQKQMKKRRRKSKKMKMKMKAKRQEQIVPPLQLRMEEQTLLLTLSIFQNSLPKVFST